MSAADLALIQSILIIQTKFLGDLVLIEPLVRTLRRHCPAARITVLCAAGFAAFLQAQGLADDVLTIDRGRSRGLPPLRAWEFTRVLLALRRSRYDLVIDLANTRSTRSFLDYMRAGRRVRYDRLTPRRLERDRGDLVADAVREPNRHYLERTLSPLAALGIAIEGLTPSIAPTEAARLEVTGLLERHALAPGRFIAVHPGASFPGRRWPPERFAAAIGALGSTGLPVALVGGPDERAITAEIASVAGPSVKDLAGAMSLPALAAFFAEARLFIGNDSGPMHLAAAVGTPVVGLFGLQSPARWGPQGVAHVTVRPTFPCPCVAPDLCKRPDPNKAYCVWRVPVDSVVSAVERLLAITQART